VVWLVTAGVLGVLNLYVGQEVGLHEREQKGTEGVLPSKRLMRSLAFIETAFELRSGSLVSNGETTR
jgi:hypothetical protein